MDELLDVEQVDQIRREKGVTIKWLMAHLGLSRSGGYMMFKNGLLPKDPVRRKTVLEKLSAFLGREVRQILLNPHRPRRSA